MKRALWSFLFLAWTGIASGHEVHPAIEATAAVVVTLTYADGSPFAYEKYELYPAGQETPMQVGNSDARGRIVFVAGDVGDWRLRAFSADGHGTDLRFAAPTTASPAATGSGDLPGRSSLLVTGLAVLFGVFGLIQLFLRRSKP
jgi:nickel transport protein